MDNVPPEVAIIIGMMVARFLYNTHRFFKAIDLLTECLVLLKEASSRKVLELPFSKLIELSLRKGLAAAGLYIYNCGMKYYGRGQFKESIQCHERGLNIFKEISWRSREAWSHCELGRALHGVCRYDEALEHYRKALEIPGLNEADKQFLEGRVYNNIGEVYGSRGYFYESRPYYEKALEISKAAENKIEMAVSYNNLGTICHNCTGELDDALIYHHKALEIRKACGYRLAELTSYHNIGGVYQQRGEYQKALGYYEKSLQISQEINNRRCEGNNLLFIGKVYSHLGDLKKATKYTKQALNILSEVGVRNSKGAAHGDLGNLYTAFGDYQKALEQYTKYLEISEEIGDIESKGLCYSNMSHVYISLGEYEKSMEYIAKFIDILQKTGEKAALGKAYHTIGSICRSAEKSLEYLKKALKLNKETGDKEGEAATTVSLGQLYLSLGDHDKANSYAEKALAISKETGEKQSAVSSYTLLGSIKLVQGQTQKAIEYETKALEIIKEIGMRNQTKLIVLEMLGLAYASEQEFSKACDSLLEGVKHHQSTRSSLKDEANVLSFDSQNLTCFKRLSWLFLCQGKVNDALFTLELGRGRALVDLISKKYGIQKAATAIEATSSSLQKFFQQQKRNFLFIAMLQGIFALWLIDKRGNIKFKRGLKTVISQGEKVDEAEDGCEVDRSFLEEEELQCEDRSLSALYSDGPSEGVGKSSKTKALGTRKGKGTARNEQERCRQSGYTLFGQYDAYYALIAPFADIVEDPEIVICPEGPLLMVPFAALQDDSGKYLSDKVRIRLIPSITTLKIIHDSPALYHCTSGALVVGDPKVGPFEVEGKVFELCPLPKAREEAQMISRLLGVPCLLGDQATKEEVLHRIQEVSLVHIAAHADAERGEVALAPNSSITRIPKKDEVFLTLKDVAEVGIRAKLVVLSCCHSAGGKTMTAEGVVGIARAFLASGARSVLMSLWAVDDEATKYFMEIFYKLLILEKMSASEALQQTMKNMRETPMHKDVKHWAPFVLLGDDVSFDFKK